MFGISLPLLGNHRRRVAESADLHTWPRRLLLANDPHHFGIAACAQTICIQRSLASEKLVQQHPQRIDIAARINSETADFGLLGTHVRRRADHLAVRGVNRFFRELLAEGLRDAEIDHFDDRPAVVERDHDIRRLQIAMDDSFLVSVLNRPAHIGK